MRNNDVSKARGRFCTDPGNPIHTIYDSAVDPDGTIVLKPIGRENTDEIIESYRESTELSNIIARFLNGESDVLNRYTPMYADMTEFPKNYREVLDSFIRAENAFNALPLETRRMFDSDWRKWLSQAGTESWLNSMSQFIKSPEKPPAASEPAVKETSAEAE